MEKFRRAIQATDDSIIRRMFLECLITKATNIHLEYVILTAFLLQQWLHERASVTLHLHWLLCLIQTALYLLF